MNIGKKLKENKGITLIALVVTIIVLLILAGISINMLTGQNGILKQASTAKEMTDNANTEELINLSVADAISEGRGDLKDKNLKSALNNNIGEGNYTISGNEDNGWKVIVNEKRYNIDTNGTTKKEELILASGLEISGKMTIEEAEISDLTVTQGNNGNEEIEWSSSNENVKVEKKGDNTSIITGNKVGSATITAKAKSSEKTATFDITVNAPTYIDNSYVEYNVGYTDFYTEKSYTRLTGWRLLKETPNEQDSNKKDIEIISTGIPAILYYNSDYITSNTWAGTTKQVEEYVKKYYTSGSNTYSNMYEASGLRYNFKNIIFEKGQAGKRNTAFYTRIINNGEIKTETIDGGIFVAGNLDSKKVSVRSVMHSDITKNEKSSDITVKDPEDKAGLFILKNYTPDIHDTSTGVWYWLASPRVSSSGIYMNYVSQSGFLGNTCNNGGGIRPVVSITGVQLERKEGNDNVWKIIE